MKDATNLLERCRALGAKLVPIGDRLRIQAPQALPDEVVAELIEAKAEVLAELQRQRDDPWSPWILQEWRRISIPAWRRILLESIESNDVKREEYARWMLHEVLEDDEYKENDR